MTVENYLFLIFAGIGGAVFIRSCYQRLRLLSLGTNYELSGSYWHRIWNLIVYPLLQRCAINRKYLFGLNHALLFWSFLVLLLANGEFIISGIFPQITFANLPDGWYFPLAFTFDVVSILALLSVILAVSRRLFFAPKYIEAKSKDAFIILGLVGSLMLAFFFNHSAEIALEPTAAAAYMPVSNLMAETLWNTTPRSTLMMIADVSWWLHALILLIFLNYLPYSKHMHVLTSIPNVYLRRFEHPATPRREEFTPDSKFGDGQINEFTWKSLLDTFACTECGRCSDNCPATRTGKDLNPRLVIHNLKVNLLKNGPLLLSEKPVVLPLINEGRGGSIGTNTLWDCTTCGACVNVCPVFIEQYPRIIEMRRYLVETRSNFPDELLGFFDNMEQRSNPWGLTAGERTKWTTGLDVKIFQPGQTEYLLYTGCFGSYDARAKHITVAVSKILNAAGISWGILGKDEKCCGDSVRQLGNEYVFEKMVKENIKVFETKGIKKVITTCPHCFNTLKQHYPQFGIQMEVIHHTEFIADLINRGKLPLQPVDFGKVIYHDPCYLGRYHQMYDEPRSTLKSATGQKPLEFDSNRESSFCCGAGGGRMWLEESQGKRINIQRTEDALEKKPGTICVACPYCMTMFEDGLKDKGAPQDLRVLDIAEIVVQAMK